MSSHTCTVSPWWMLNCAILSAPNTRKRQARGYWSFVCMTNSCDFHGFPVLFETPSLAGYSLIITPSTSMPCNAMILNCILLLDMFSLAKLTKISLNGKYTG